jgi:glutathione S-transferase
VSRPLLFTDHGCAFAHRVLALLDGLEVELDHEEAPPHERPPGLARYSTSGRVPLLVHGDLVIGESTVMLEHLAEFYGFTAAWPRSLTARTRQRHAMAFADAALTPRLFNPGEPSARLDECLDTLGAVVRDARPEPSLLAFHLAPVALRLRLWRPGSAATRGIQARPALAAWLEAAAALDSVARTARGTDPAFVSVAQQMLG